MLSLVIPYSSTISSGVIPPASEPRISPTVILVPSTIGLPNLISSSIIIVIFLQ